MNNVILLSGAAQISLAGDAEEQRDLFLSVSSEITEIGGVVDGVCPLSE